MRWLIALVLISLVAVARAEDRVVVVEETSADVFFANEDAEVRAALSRWVEKAMGRKVAPPAEVEKVRLRALGGQNLMTGASCGAPLHAHTAYEQVFGPYDGTRLEFPCEKAKCKMAFSVHRHGGDTLRYEAELEGAPTKSSALRAINRLKSAPVPPRTRGGGLFGVSIGDKPRQESRVKLSLWGEVLDKQSFAVAQRELDRCARPGGGQEMFLLSTDGNAEIDRCEGRAWNATPSRDCVCAALKTVVLPKSAAHRRVAFDVSHEARDVVAGTKILGAYLTGAADRSMPAHGLGVAALECFRDAPPREKLTIPLEWTIRPDATVETVAIEWPANRVSATQRACVSQVLRAARFPCPAPEDSLERKAILVIR